MSDPRRTIYCVDTSALIDLARQYPRNVFPGLWRELDALVDAGRLIAPVEVKKEIEQGEDLLSQWARRRRRMFVGLTPAQLAWLTRILEAFPAFAGEAKPPPYADPHVIALVLSRRSEGRQVLFPQAEHVVVTHERPNPKGKPRMPDVCRHYQIECIRLPELFQRENWRFP